MNMDAFVLSPIYSPTVLFTGNYSPHPAIIELTSVRPQSPTPTTTEIITMPGRHVHFNEENIFYSPAPSESSTSPTLSESSLPSSTGPTTPPQLREFIPLGPVTINPILAYHPFVFPINYDVSYPPNTASANIRASPFNLDSYRLAEAATSPPIPVLSLQNDLLPWRCEIRASTCFYVTVGDVLTQLYSFLRTPGTREEFKATPSQSIRDTISAVYRKRCSRASSAEAYAEEQRKGLKRVDFLMGRTTFMGLSSTKLGPEAWVLNLQ
ncbi:uncharacterized protein F5891DRAFT_113694 [Suillus fuscotomentosus]|uniref:DUF6699 domain-containing protein n=1 Tax=Suillus fuscotomentosus TaxID=1912939 RepID=A0AAD4EBS2_9AGAM|nr:uncharacterized protein F5891DRAFT_113694 [Suillus fuscotomentosus]KAG1903046.1 hypothetical protein F5891DRAFT_113694 [Suillus fuscotomentosus]